MSADSPPTAGKQLAEFCVNGERQEVAFRPHHTLLEVLREELGLNGTTSPTLIGFRPVEWGVTSIGGRSAA